LALALNPLVDFLQKRGIRRRGAAVAIAYVVGLAAIAGIAAAFIPTLVDQVNNFANKVPDYVHDLTHGRGRLGFLETRYHVVEKVRNAVESGGVRKLIGIGGGAALTVTKSGPNAVALGLVVALLDLIPLAGATLAAIVVVLVALAAKGLTAAIVVAVFFIVYQQVENHLLQPVVYGRTVQLSPLAVLIAVLIGAEV